MRAKIVVAAHKPYPFPDTELYVPIQVGAKKAAKRFGYAGDDTGENISEKNPEYSELTALYWAWKNDLFRDADIVGLVHYRRYFSGSLPFRSAKILSEKNVDTLFGDEQVDILVPKKRNYFIETVESHYAHAHFPKDLKTAEEVLKTLYPTYLPAWEEVMRGTKLHLYNMFLMRRELFDAYCAWLFPLLFEIERRIDISAYDPYQRRVFGFLAERLFNVWTRHRSRNGLEVREHPIVQLEGEKIFSKGLHLLARKFRLKRK